MDDTREQKKNSLAPIFKDDTIITRRLNFSVPLSLHKLLKARARQLNVSYSEYFIMLAMQDMKIDLDVDSIPNVWKYDESEIKEKIDGMTAQRYKKALENLLTILETSPEELTEIYKEELTNEKE